MRSVKSSRERLDDAMDKLRRAERLNDIWHDADFQGWWEAHVARATDEIVRAPAGAEVQTAAHKLAALHRLRDDLRNQLGEARRVIERIEKDIRDE